ncbi:MAG: hypothetical protein FWH57_02680 [Oscillospiraceae bacterium]|nr:hypothetical protein [Oscillospiraceae bacterium]
MIDIDRFTSREIPISIIGLGYVGLPVPLEFLNQKRKTTWAAAQTMISLPEYQELSSGLVKPMRRLPSSFIKAVNGSLSY